MYQVDSSFPVPEGVLYNISDRYDGIRVGSVIADEHGASCFDVRGDLVPDRPKWLAAVAEAAS